MNWAWNTLMQIRSFFSIVRHRKLKKLTSNRWLGTEKVECIDLIDKITKVYIYRCFTISMYNGDNALTMIRDHVGHTNLNMVARGEYVGHIERSI